MYQYKWEHLSAAPSVTLAPSCIRRVRIRRPQSGAAIRRHRGEALDASQRFRGLRPSDQQALLEFLRSL